MKKESKNTFILIILIICIIAIAGIFASKYIKSGIIDAAIAVYTEIRNIQTENQISDTDDIAEGEEINQTAMLQNTDINDLLGDNKEKNLFYYEQLDVYSKKFYDEMSSNIENMKSGNYKVDFGLFFSDYINIQGQDALMDAYSTSLRAFFSDNPEVFYIDSSKIYIHMESIARGSIPQHKVFIDNGENPNYYTDGFTSKEQINEAINEIEMIRDEIISSLSRNK